MKLHIYLAAAAAALVALTGCEREVMPEVENVTSEAIPVWFESSGRPSTKVDVDGTTGAGTWTEGDKIAVYIAGSGADFYQIKPVTDIDSGTGKVLLSLPASQNRANYAIYPADAAVEGHITENDLYVTYPDTYDYSMLTIAQAETYTPAPMVAVNSPISTDPDVDIPPLYFYHVGGVLRVTIPNVPSNAHDLRFTFPEGLKFSGTFKVNDPGTENATLTPAGDDHSNVILVKLPVLSADKQTVTINIPLPEGDYTTTERDYKVEVVGEQFSFMGTDGIFNWNLVERAQGKKVTLPALETLGKIAGLYFVRGWLNRPNTSTVSPSDMSISTGSQLQILAYCNQDPNQLAKKFFFSWNELGKIMTGDSSFDGSSSYEDATLGIGDNVYRLPTVEEWRKVMSNGRPGSIVNGESRKYFSKVRVNLSGSDYDGFDGFVNGLLIFPDGGTFDCESLTNFNTGDTPFTEISFIDFRNLTDGPAACLFLPCTGQVNNNSWLNAGVYGYYWPSTYKDNSNAYTLFIGNNRVNPLDAGNKGRFYPVRLIQENVL